MKFFQKPQEELKREDIERMPQYLALIESHGLRKIEFGIISPKSWTPLGV
jgi:hypothetical protein